MAKRHNQPAAREIFAANVRRYRQSKGISQERFAAMAGVHRTYIGSVERGECNVSIDNMERLARALGVPLPRLLEPATTEGV